MKKHPNTFPRGWNAARVARVIAHYEQQTEAQAAAEDEAAFGRGIRLALRDAVRCRSGARDMLSCFCGSGGAVAGAITG